MATIALILFIAFFLFILFGYPIAFTLGGLSTVIGVWVLGVDFFVLLPPRILGIMSNQVLIAVPLFVFMGLMLERSGLAGEMLITMGALLGKVRGGLLVSVILVGGMLAASTGIVGATVVTMGLISLPTLLKHGYSPKIASGAVAASGTLGQIIPPSIVLILLGSVLNVSVGDLFGAALVPGLLLILCYIVYIVVLGYVSPKKVGLHIHNTNKEQLLVPVRITTRKVVDTFVMPFLLIVLVLGSILFGVASPSESAAIGALGAMVMTAFYGKLKWKTVQDVSQDTAHLTSMIFFILLGATTFSLVFRGLEGDQVLRDLVLTADSSPRVFLAMCMLLIFFLGFFLDFVEIVFVIVPIIAPLLAGMGYDMIEVGILLAFNLQTSFLTPPFGFSLFYLKGVVPKGVSSGDIYIGVLPFVAIQLIFLVVLFMVTK